MRTSLFLVLYLVVVPCGGCDQPGSRRVLGSDHFVAMQRDVGRGGFANASVYLDSEFAGRGDGMADMEVSDARVLAELRWALLEAKYDGPDLDWFGPDPAYAMTGDGHFMALTVHYAVPSPAGKSSLRVHVHGCRFSFDNYGFCQDSFQSPRLARLIRQRLLPATAPKSVATALDYLGQGVMNSKDCPRAPPLEDGYGRQAAPLPLGSDHFIAMQFMVRRVVFAKAMVALDEWHAGRPVGKPDLEVSDAAAMNELRLALLDAFYDGPDLDKTGAAAAYEAAADKFNLNVTMESVAPLLSGMNMLSINVYGSRFSLSGHGFAQDSFQSPRLARLIRSRLLPSGAGREIVQTLDSLEQKAPHR